jgi:hypothetical protein
MVLNFSDVCILADMLGVRFDIVVELFKVLYEACGAQTIVMKNRVNRAFLKHRVEEQAAVVTALWRHIHRGDRLPLKVLEGAQSGREVIAYVQQLH